MFQKIILASGSPRRRELMTRLGINFQYVTSKAKEDMTSNIPVGELAIKNAAMKGYDVANLYDEAFIIAADTIVSCEDKVFGKPASEQDVFDMLTFLSGKKHQVTTGVAIINKRAAVCERFFKTTDVYFKKYGEGFIKWYIKTEEPFDKAGSYAIQGKGSLMVDKIEGCYDNVVGLPVSELFERLIKFGVRPGGLNAY
jgi:septum formation protein